MRGRGLAALAVGVGVMAGLNPVQAMAGVGDLVVNTDSGPVRGVLGEDHRRFDGVPYAAPPVGELLWSSPQRDPTGELRPAAPV